VFPAASNKREIADKQKMDDSNNILEGTVRLILPSLQETGRASEDPKLPIDNRRKIILPYKQ